MAVIVMGLLHRHQGYRRFVLPRRRHQSMMTVSSNAVGGGGSSTPEARPRLRTACRRSCCLLLGCPNILLMIIRQSEMFFTYLRT
eukprot:scaffold205_cov83-Skeletonema_dohrnii-CCMP3373.AAC.3